MNTNKKTWTLAAVAFAAATFSAAVQAQSMDHSAHKGMAPAAPAASPAAPAMGGMDHSAHQGMQAPAPAAAAAPAMSGMDHSAHQGMQAPAPAAAPAAGAMDHSAGGMEHGDMQGGSAPADARDPHAYAGGNTLSGGAYGLGQRQLYLGDEHNWGMILADRLEAVRTNERTTGAYELMGRFGRDYDRLVVKAEGEIAGGRIEESRTEALWSHAVATFWDAQLGLRYDTGPGPGRTWAAFGVQGLAPYWFETDAAFYVGESGRTALRLSAEYELLLTQRWVLQPRVEANFYGKDDPENGIGKGLSSLTAGLRLRYEFSRQFAPYVGVEWAGSYGETARLRQAEGEDRNETRFVAGLRMWF